MEQARVSPRAILYQPIDLGVASLEGYVRTAFSLHWRARDSDTLQIFDQVVLLGVAQLEIKLRIVVVHYVEQRREPPVVEKAALLVRP